jgi:CheY-like chemotaxis protein
MQVSASSALRVLVVDDNVDTTAGLALLLRSWGHEVAVAHDGPAALEAADAFRPQAVLLDIGLPLLSGFEVAQRLRQAPADGGRPFLVAFSGYNRESDRRRAREVGIDIYLVKPFDPFGLESLLAERPVAAEAIPA